MKNNNYNYDYRDTLLSYNPNTNKTRNKMTLSEIALIIGKRATQIANGAEPNIEVKPGMTEIEIATEELRQKQTPYIIERTLGSSSILWKIKDLEVNIE